MGLADSSRRIRIADIELAYRITGRGKPVILVHGEWGTQRSNWVHR
jgi:pimeloyl-ACP methyl ester carboxylesterase